MLRRITSLLSRVRERPERERRILGLTAYLALSAMLLALWVDSFRASLGPARLAGGEGARPAGATEREAEEPTLAALLSPFEALREAARDSLNRVRELAIRPPAPLGAEPALPELANAATPETGPARGTAISGAAGPDRAPAATAPPRHPESPAGIAATVGGSSAPSPADLALLVSPPESAPPAPAEPGALARLAEIIRLNLATIRQAATDFSRYLTE